ncbi:MAG: preprotein translocase subunit SecG [Clostridium sp.]|jgi:preprotein translocase subunit SecG|nr:preprotein translocase subunit SecG [Clostridium sp.]
MEIYEIVLGALLIVVSIAIAALVLLQEGKSQGLSGAIAGGADTFFGKNKGRTIEQLLVKITRVVAIAFFVLVLGTFLVFLFL